MKNIYFIIYIYFSSLEIKEKKKCMSLKIGTASRRERFCLFVEKKSVACRVRWTCWLCGRPVCKQTWKQAAARRRTESGGGWTCSRPRFKTASDSTRRPSRNPPFPSSAGPLENRFKGTLRQKPDAPQRRTPSPLGSGRAKIKQIKTSFELCKAEIFRL